MITDIHLQNFRSYSDDSFEFEPGVNIIVGPNASGKTNLLESIVVLARGSSYRAPDKELIKDGGKWSKIEARINNLNRIIKIENSNDTLNKTLEINSKIYRRLPLSKTIPVVLFEPNLLTLFTGPPKLRREFIDNILEQTKEGFRSTNLKFKKALTQRNYLLKGGSVNTKQLFVWNIRLSELSGQVVKERLELIKHFLDKINQNYSEISKGKEELSLIYQTKCNPDKYESDLLLKLEKNIEEEQRTGFTLFGPHRDDIIATINNRPAASVASRGETRTIIISLKIIEALIIEELRGIKPILLFDDVFSELDGRRRVALIELLGANQSFVTTTDADVVIQRFITKANTIALLR